jgi:hypothetical protein
MLDRIIDSIGEDESGPMADSHFGCPGHQLALNAVQAARKAFTLQTVPASERPSKPFLASHAGFSLHAGVAVRGGDQQTLERLCRYIARPALAEGRLSLTPQGRVRYNLKTPYRDGTTHVVFAPQSRWRSQVTPAGRSSGTTAAATRTPAERHRAMSWAQRLKRVFNLDLAGCENCGGQVRVLACVEDPAVIGKILEHLATRRPDDSVRPGRASGRALYALSSAGLPFDGAARNTSQHFP